MKKILLIDCHSTSLNYIHDCYEMGLEPIILSVPWINSSPIDFEMFGDKKPQVIVADKDYQKTLELVKQVGPSLILPSGEASLELSCRLSEDLGLPTNKWEKAKQIINKFACHEMLKKAGIRHIDGKKVTTKDEIKQFFTEHGNRVVIKPETGTASVGVFICQNEKELLKAFNEIDALVKQPGRENTHFIVQEFTPGAELVVNTCTCNGQHKVTSLWLYEKKILPGFAPCYERVIFLHPEDILVNTIIDYTKKVLTAIGVECGPCHTELVVDAKGPVLIEVNMRIAGASMRWQYLDKVLGHHETNVSLMSFLEPQKFLEPDRNFFKPISHGVVKFIDMTRDAFVIKPTVDECFKHLPSYFCYNLVSVHPAENFLYQRTIDLDTSAGAVFLLNNDKDQLRRDLRFVNMTSKYHIEKMFLIDESKK